MRRRPRSKPDEGAVLVIVLLFVVVVAVVAAAVMDQVRASIGNTVIVRNQQALTFAADSGIERALQMVRRDSRLCNGSGVQSLGAPISVNGRQVTLECETITASSSGVFGHAVVTLDNSGPSLTTQGGGTKQINGPVYTARIDAVSNLVVSGGDVLEQAGANSCVVGGSKPSGLTMSPASLYSYSCTTDGPPTFTPSLPSTIPPPALPPLDIGTCRTFFPGRYTTWPGFLDENYMISGVYLLDGVSIAVSGNQKVVAGRRHPLEPNSLGMTPCSNDSVLPTASGYGVKILLGGSSSITTASSGGSMELFARKEGPAAEGTQGVTVMQVTSSAGGWPASSRGVADDIVTISSGSNPSLVVHGVVSTPQARLNIDNASSTSSAQFLGGLYTGRLHLQNSGSSSGLMVSIDIEPSPKLVKLIARTRLDTADKEIRAAAVVRVDNNPQRTYQIQSWRSTN